MGLLGLRTSTSTKRAAAVEEEEAGFQPLKFLGSMKNRIKRRISTLRGKPSLSVADALLTARIRKTDLKKAAPRNLAEDSWEEMLPEVLAVPRNLAEDSWEDRILPEVRATTRNLAESGWEDRILPDLRGEAVVAAPPVMIPRVMAAAPAAKRDLAESGWEDRLLPGEAPAAGVDVRGPRQLSETSWEDHLLPPDATAGSAFKRDGLSSWEDLLP